MVVKGNIKTCWKGDLPPGHPHNLDQQSIAAILNWVILYCEALAYAL